MTYVEIAAEANRAIAMLKESDNGLTIYLHNDYALAGVFADGEYYFDDGYEIVATDDLFTAVDIIIDALIWGLEDLSVTVAMEAA